MGRGAGRGLRAVQAAPELAPGLARREREGKVLARLHHYVAAIERLRFAAVNSRSADASRSTSELQPLVDELETLGRDLDLSREAWNELAPA